MLKRVYIEITSACNLSCSFCTVSSRERKYMKSSFFEAVIRQVREITPYICLHVQGEPLLHPDIDEILTLCDQYGMQVQLVTNGLLISRLKPHASIRKVSFSMQSVEFMKNSAKEYMEPVLQYCEQASKAERPYCELRFWRTDQMSLSKTRECLDTLHDRFPFEETSKPGSYRLMRHVYADFSKPFDWPDLKADLISERGTCRGALDQIAILCDGTVVPCCLDAEGVIRLGDLNTMILKDILNGERYRSICEGFRRHELREELCRKCSFRTRFR
ncbi:MAG: SPASM domain-containing protein [Solobacterium sp.]|nr:SPASM domain-containing protein [Solobacterium sp.]